MSVTSISVCLELITLIVLRNFNRKHVTKLTVYDYLLAIFRTFNEVRYNLY